MGQQRRLLSGALTLRRPRQPRLAASRLLALVLAVLAAGCIVVPRTTSRWDHGCQVQTRQVTLEALPFNGVVLNCTSTPANCTAALVVAGVIGSASAVVSGSIAVVGNVVYWLEKQGNCNGAAPTAALPAGLPAGLPAALPAGLPAALPAGLPAALPAAAPVPPAAVP